MSNAATADRSTAPCGRSILSGAVVPPVEDDALRFPDFAPATGAPIGTRYQAASAEEVDAAVRAAAQASTILLRSTGGARAALLDAIADRLHGLGDTLLTLASTESGLPIPRLTGERDRTVNQLRLFATVAKEGSWVEACIDRGDPDRTPLPKPDLRRMLRPVGPVAVFGASNFPLAFSVAGGDTASALAAGCPVVVKGHPAHPGTGELVAHAVSDAVRVCGFPAGTFSFLHAGGTRSIAVGEELVRHVDLRAAGFTGSQRAGLALAQLAAQRPEPIPIFCEMGAVNPIVACPGAIEADPSGRAAMLLASVTASVGQMCTCPGLLFLVRTPAAESFVDAIERGVREAEPGTMLSAGIHAAYEARIAGVSALDGVQVTRATSAPDGLVARPTTLVTAWSTFRSRPELSEECFGPSTVIVLCDDESELLEAARSMQGTLATTLWSTDADRSLAESLLPVLECRAGRVLFEGVPTGVEVCTAMVHAGPFPACTRPDETAVGPHAIRRWCRPVCFQGAPDHMLPPELQDANPNAIHRTVDGVKTGG